MPGCEGWLRQGKRYLIPAAAGTGKSLAWLVIAVGIVERGGTVVILDVENGSDEYAHRLQCILDAHGDDLLAEHCRERLRYYEWPRLSLEWEPDELVATMAGADVVIFDSSRLALSQVGLDEDRSGDYADFVNALLLPLAKAGITTIMLDNVGHSNGDRARGTKAKEDLNEVVYQLKAIRPADIDTTGTAATEAHPHPVRRTAPQARDERRRRDLRDAATGRRLARRGRQLPPDDPDGARRRLHRRASRRERREPSRKTSRATGARSRSR